MKKTAILLSAAVLAGAFRPLMRHDCAGSAAACAPRPAAASCHRTPAAPACHKAAAPAPRECPGMACCIVQDDRAALAALSLSPRFSEEGDLPAEAPAATLSVPPRFASSPSPPGRPSPSGVSLSSPSPRGPPVLA